MPGDREYCLEVGMDDFLAKPIDLSSLLAIVQQWVVDNNKESEIAGFSEVIKPLEEKKLAISNIPNNDKFLDYAELLSRMDNDEEIIRVVAEAFLQDIPDRIISLEKAIKDNNIEEISEIAHSIKGTAANISADALSSSALKIEQALKKGDASKIQPIFEEMQVGFVQLKNILQKLIE